MSSWIFHQYTPCCSIHVIKYLTLLSIFIFTLSFAPHLFSTPCTPPSPPFVVPPSTQSELHLLPSVCHFHSHPDVHHCTTDHATEVSGWVGLTLLVDSNNHCIPTLQTPFSPGYASTSTGGSLWCFICTWSSLSSPQTVPRWVLWGQARDQSGHAPVLRVCGEALGWNFFETLKVLASYPYVIAVLPVLFSSCSTPCSWQLEEGCSKAGIGGMRWCSSHIFCCILHTVCPW